MNTIIKICWTVIISFGIITLATASETKRVCKTDEKTKKEVCMTCTSDKVNWQTDVNGMPMTAS